jgi:membrane protein YdbS with pleckstrin-like domain
MTISSFDATDPAEEDIAWGHYSGRALLPSFIVCGLLSLALLTGGWFFEDIRGIGQDFGSLIFFEVTIAIWIVQISRWLYRGSTYTYRLTNKHLYIDRGFLYDRQAPIPLAKIAKVEWGCDVLGYYAGVGWVRVTTATPETIVMKGIRRPAAFAELIERKIKKA